MKYFEYKPGDIWACFGNDRVSRAITYGTLTFRPWAPRRLKFGPSHVAIACEHRGDIVWVESTTLCQTPCIIRGDKVSGCQAHFPEDRIHDYLATGGRVDLYRPCAISSLDKAARRKLKRILIRHFVMKGIDYDLGGALISGTRIAKRFLTAVHGDLDKVFCSELIAAALVEVGKLNHSNATRYNPASLLRRLVSNGTYSYVPEFNDAQQSIRMMEETQI